MLSDETASMNPVLEDGPVHCSQVETVLLWIWAVSSYPDLAFAGGTLAASVWAGLNSPRIHRDRGLISLKGRIKRNTCMSEPHPGLVPLPKRGDLAKGLPGKVWHNSIHLRKTNNQD